MKNSSVANSFRCCFAACFLFAFAASAWATDPKFYAVEVSATVQASPAQVVLHWPTDPNATGYTVARRPSSSAAWTILASLPGTASSYLDANVANFNSYEYQITSSTTLAYHGTGYINAGINAPLQDSLGKVILLVDTTYAEELAPELARLQQDLRGDGWQILRHDVARTDSVTAVKSIIKADYDADPTHVRSVFIFGHVAVPYSGNFNPDGHPDHQGAWPADAYYGDMNGVWTDTSVNTSAASRAANRNVPGDGKFDQIDLPSDVELEVGRVDLANMTCFSNKTFSRNERDLLRQYLNKDHNFRHRLFTLQRRGAVCDNFGERDGEAFAASGWRNFAPFFGAANTVKIAGGSFFNTLASQDYLWSYGTGGGSYYTCAGVGGSDDFALTDVKTVFTMFLGSYFGDWDNESNFLRAPLGSTSYCLTASWSGRPHWFYHHMALGQTIGYSTKLSQNNRNGGDYQNQNFGTHRVHIALMGDPTLRMFPVIPPSNLTAATVGSATVLSWAPSTDSNLQGYHVYRAASPAGPFTRLTSAPTLLSAFTDAAPGDYTYMVRAIKLEQSGSGTFYNPSQGAFVSVGTIPGDPGAPSAPTGLTSTVMSSSQINVFWSDNSNTETAFRVYRKTGATGAYSAIATLAANTTAYSSVALNYGTQYYYRVSAINGAGESAFSNEINATTQPQTVTDAAATFVSLDKTTRGNWKGVYGADGYNIVADGGTFPAYATITTTGASQWVWNYSTTDPAALVKSATTDRIASCWYAPTSYSINVNLTDGKLHRLALYCLDWDKLGRQQTVEVADGVSGAVLHTQTLTAFDGGSWLVWDVKGKVTITLKGLVGNAVAAGLFFSPASAAMPLPAATPVITPAGGNFTSPASVAITTATPLAAIRYTLDGSIPTASSPLFTAPFTVSSSTTVKAKAFLVGLLDSAVASASFTVTPQVAAPVISPAGGSYASAKQIIFSGAPSGAVMRYTLDGSEPTLYSLSYSGPMMITASGTLKAKAFLPGSAPSATTSATFTISGYPPAAKAVFFGANSTTQGSWKGMYGTDGYQVVGDTANPPAFAHIIPNGKTDQVWASSTTDLRGLQKVFSPDRIAAGWSASNSFTTDLNLTDGKTHRVTLYFVDWDRLGRAQTIDILDAVTGTVLNTRTINSFQNGSYQMYEIMGSVKIRITRTGGGSAVLNGLFFNTPLYSL